jgi:molecular chaperone IbpA
MAGGLIETVAQWRTTLCVPTISLRFIVPPSASTASSTCSTRSLRRQPRLSPYNIERTGENAYRISVAVSGFSQGELSIVAKENTLTIKGEKSANENGKDNSEVLYRGIAARAFERVFQLADFVQVKNASLENGLLHVDLVREIPEAKKPRSIPINSGAKAPQVVDASVAA